MAGNFNLKAVISAVDKLSPVLKNIARASKSTQKAVSEISSAGSQLGGAISGAMAPLAAITGLGAVGFGGFVGKVVQTSAEFEKFQTILETVEGSSEAAKKSMDWVSDFAAKTPYELQEVTSAFVKLKSYGIEPQSGALKAAGDAAAAMGKPLEQAVEAMADAMTGENERLKEFGIVAKKQGDKIVYTWTENGKTMAAKADANNKAMIQSTLEGIWNRRYGGAMDKLSGTWDGMLSNVKDSISRFFLSVGDAGLFGFLKDEMSGVLTTLNGMAEDGSLKELAQTISDELVAALKELKTWVASVDWKGVWQDVKGVVSGIKSFIDAIGGIKSVAIGLGVILAVQILAPMWLIIAAAAKLSFSLGSIAVGAATGAAGLTGLTASLTAAKAAAMALLVPLAKVAAAGAAGYAVGTALNEYVINPAVQKLTGNKDASLGSWLYDAIHGDGSDQKAAPGQTAAPAPSQSPVSFVTPRDGAQPSVLKQMQTNQVGKAQVQGEMLVKFENAPPGTRVAPGKTNHPGLAMNPNVGYSSNANLGAV